MELNPRYKQTEVGLIPEDWDVKFLPDVLRFRSGKAHEQFISDTGSYVCVNSKFISTGGNVRKYSSANFSPARKGDVLMVMSDLPNGRALAKSYFVEADNTYAVNQRVCALTAYRDNPKYLFYILNRNPYFLSFDDGVSQTHLLNRVFQKRPIPLPQSTKEQGFIAEVLSDVDSLLYDLDQFITKKRAIKQVAMQELLTGKRRLPGFEGEWEEVSIGGMVDLLTGFPFPSSGYSSSGVRLLRGSNVKRGLIDWNEDLAQHWPSITSDIARYELRDGDIVIAMDGALVGRSYARVQASDLPALLLQRVARIRSSSLCNDFLFFQIGSSRFADHCDSVKTSTAIPHISPGDIRNFKTLIPPTKNEQIAIAAILLDLDAEISGLETRLNKVRELKQGMMQQLLTGKIRLK